MVPAAVPGAIRPKSMSAVFMKLNFLTATALA